MRTLLLTYRDVSADELNIEDDVDIVEDKAVKNLVVVGVAGIADPLREEVPRAV